VKILLLTRCGASQWRNIPDESPPRDYRIALTVKIDARWFSDFPRDVPSGPEIRRFEYRDSSRYGNFAVYEEVP